MFTSVVTGIITYKKYKNSPSRYVIWFLAYAYLVSVTMAYTRYVYSYEFLHTVRDYLLGTFFEKNVWLSTLFWRIGATLFILFIYFKHFEKRAFKIIVRFISVLFFVISIALIFIDFSRLSKGYYEFHQVGSMTCILICVGLYFIELIQSERILNFNRLLMFYVSCAFLFFYLIINGLIFYERYFTIYDMTYVYLRTNIYLFANIFMYSMFTFALLWCRPQKDQ